MALMCTDCKLYDPAKDINNCRAGVVGTVRKDSSACYKIQFNQIEK